MVVQLVAGVVTAPPVAAPAGPTFDQVVAGTRWSAPILPSRQDMADAAALIERVTDPSWCRQLAFDAGTGAGGGVGYADGRSFRVLVSPGVVGLRSFDLNRAERREGPAPLGRTLDEIEADDARGSRQRITEWSGRSRARMTRTLAQLDFSEWVAGSGTMGMVTFTLPGPWLLLAPRGAAFKRLVELLRRRWVRAGLQWVGMWKLELQSRGAPHLHAQMKVPATVDVGGVAVPFESWIRQTWADVCRDELRRRCLAGEVSRKDLRRYGKHYRRHLDHGVHFSPSANYSDPRRIAIYFAGHSLKARDGKEYQHQVPAEWQGEGDGPGRFWGFWGLRKAAFEVDLSPSEADAVARVLRGVAVARQRRADDQARRHGRDPRVRVRPVRSYVVPADLAAVEGIELDAAGAVKIARSRPVRRRKSVRSLGAGGRGVGGFVIVNDGQALAYQVARVVWLLRYSDGPASPPAPAAGSRRAVLASRWPEWRRAQVAARLSGRAGTP